MGAQKSWFVWEETEKVDLISLWKQRLKEDMLSVYKHIQSVNKCIVVKG